MKSTGIVRRIDRLGRVVLPMELRKTLGWEIKDPLEVFVEGETVILRKCGPYCVFCGETRELLQYQGRTVCPNCIRELKKL